MLFTYIGIFTMFAAIAFNMVASFQHEPTKSMAYVGLSQLVHQVVTFGLLVYILTGR